MNLMELEPVYENGEEVGQLWKPPEIFIKHSHNKSPWLVVASDYAKYGDTGGQTPEEAVENFLKKIHDST